MAFQQVGRYTLVKRIGRGGMADVWIGKVRGAGGFEKVVAIKLLPLDQVDREEYQRALTDEARVLVHLKHPNIVDVYDLNFEAENPYLVMEYVEGVELREVLRALRRDNRLLSLPMTVFIVSGIAQALAFAHGRTSPETNEPLQIVHRDVSPSNILLSIHGDVKLSDFGIAKSSLQSGVTQAGQIKGKFRYMSPEQAEGMGLDRRSDIFSLGLVFYECLFGAPAYEGPSDVGILQMARTGMIAPIKDLDPRLKQVMTRLLAPERESRYGDLKEFLKDLGEFSRSMGEVADRESLGQFLRGLNLPQFQEAASSRRQAEQWSAGTTGPIQVLDQTGRIVTLTAAARSPQKRWRPVAAGVAGLVVAGLFLAVFFRPGSGRREAFSVPQPIHPALVSPAPPAAVVPPNEGIKKIQVSFSADPYAAVSVPGQFSNLETPVSRTLPAGEYTVSFRHAASGRTASAQLRGTSGRSYVCAAKMSVTDSSSPPTANCRVR